MMQSRTSFIVFMGGVMVLSWGLSGSGLAGAAAPDSGDGRSREETPAKYRWNLADLYADDGAWEGAFTETEQAIGQLAAMKGTLGKSPQALLKTLMHRDHVEGQLGKLVLYAGTSYHLDMSASATAGRFDRIQSLGTKAAEAESWFVPEILSLPREKVCGWMGQNDELAVYRHHFDDIYRQRKHILSTREEELLAMTGDVAAAFNTIFGRLNNTDLDFPTLKDSDDNEFQLSSAKYYQYIFSPDRRLRRDVFLGLHNTYRDKRNTISAILSGQVKQHIFYAKARGFRSSLESALDGPGIPVAVVENLINTVHKHLPTVHRYVALKKKVTVLKDLHRYDLYVPMVKTSSEIQVPFDQACETVLTALKPLGDDYASMAQTAFQSRWIDVYETPNKRSGAYSWSTYQGPHPFILLNYTGTRSDRSTLAHEMGHALHSSYTTRSQPEIYGDYATFCAEVASTVNEVLLSHHLLNNAKSDQEKLLILQESLDSIRTTVIRQTMFVEFEKLIHEQVEAGKPLTGDSLCELYGELVAKYYGPEMVMDECAKAEGLRIPHFYRNFYVYTYATSHCAAINIGRRIINGEPGAVEGHIKFLSAGSSLYPLDVLKLAGVDMTTPKPIQDTMELFAELMNQFEELYGKQAAGNKKRAE